MKSMVPGIHNLQTVGSSPLQKMQQAYTSGTPLQMSNKTVNLNYNQTNNSDFDPKTLL
jgi:hypothetical protein